MRLVLVLLLCISQAFAIDVTPIKKGWIATEEGFYVDKPNMKEMRHINETKKLLHKENIKLKDLSAINEERIGVFKDRSIEYEKQMRKEQVKGNAKGILGFIIGIGAASLAGFVMIKAAGK